jgi:predicted transcriptional regulator
MKPKRDNHPIQVRFPLDVHAAMRQLAQQHERSFNGEVVWALRQYLAQQDQQQHTERAGQADAIGRTAPD